MRRQQLLFLMVAMVGVVATAGTARAAGVNPLLYGQTYTLQNLWAGNGGYLDTNGSGCQGNKLCVSTAITPIRDGGSGAWMILSASGKAPGSAVLSGDMVYLKNLWTGKGGYLDTDGNGCQSNRLCVSTANSPTRDGASGTWRILASDQSYTGEIRTDQDIHLWNMWSNGYGGFLDTKNSGCQGNMLCVSTAPSWDRDGNSTHWIFRGATHYSGTPDLSGNDGWCLTTDQPATLFDNGVSKLFWNNLGNLTLRNYAAAGTTVEGNFARGTEQHWGMNASTALTGSNAAKLCLSKAGVLSITNSSGGVVWQSSSPATTSLSNTVLQVDDKCTVSIWGTDSNGQNKTVWTLATQECQARQHINGLPVTTVPNGAPRKNQCWRASSNKVRLLWDTETNTELDWQSGHLFLIDTVQALQDPNLRLWDSVTRLTSVDEQYLNRHSYDPTQAAQLCAQADGNVVIYDAAGNALWASGSNASGGTYLTLDPCGFNYVSNSSQIAVKRADTRFDYAFGWDRPQTCQVTRLGPGKCYSKNAPATLLRGPDGVELAWRSDDPWYSTNGTRLILSKPPDITWDFIGASLWQSPAGEYICFQQDGNLVIYNGSGGPVWATNSVNGGGTPGSPFAYTPNAVSLAQEQLTVIDQLKAETCNTLNQCLRQNGNNLAACPGFTTTDQSNCATSNYWTLWTPSSQAGVTSYPLGGFSYLKNDKAGNSQFGVESWIVSASANYNTLNTLKTTLAPNGHATSAVNATVPAAPPTDYTMTMSDIGAGATLFGQSFTVFEARGYGAGANGVLGAGIVLNVLGEDLHPWSVTTEGVSVSVSYSHEFFKAEATIDVGIPVKISGAVAGSAGINFSGALSLPPTNSLTITSAPFIGYDAIVTIGTGVSGLSAGIQGDLTMIQFSVPFNVTFNYPTGSTSNYQVSANFQLTELSGSLSLYAEAGPFSASKQLAGWDGMTRSARLFSVKGDL